MLSKAQLSLLYSKESHIFPEITSLRRRHPAGKLPRILGKIMKVFIDRATFWKMVTYWRLQ